MKQQDIAVIIVVVFISGFVSFFLSGQFISSPKNRKQTVEVVQPITAEFKLPNDKYINIDSYAPAQLIIIGNDNNQKPFN